MINGLIQRDTDFLMAALPKGNMAPILQFAFVADWNEFGRCVYVTDGHRIHIETDIDAQCGVYAIVPGCMAPCSIKIEKFPHQQVVLPNYIAEAEYLGNIESNIDDRPLTLSILVPSLLIDFRFWDAITEFCMEPIVHVSVYSSASVQIELPGSHRYAIVMPVGNFSIKEATQRILS